MASSALGTTPMKCESSLDPKANSQQVVDDFSSRLGWPTETVETIDADHREMIREAGVKDISDVLKELEDEIVKGAVAAEPASTSRHLPPESNA